MWLGPDAAAMAPDGPNIAQVSEADYASPEFAVMFGAKQTTMWGDGTMSAIFGLNDH